MPNFDSDFKIYCLEAVPNLQQNHNSTILPSLEKLALQYGITNVYQTCDSIESFESNVNTLLYEDRNFHEYEIIYLVVEGHGNQITIDNYNYTLEEIAEIFEGKLKGKQLHFANTMQLNLDAETAQYFIDVTGVTAVSGYQNAAPIVSTILDNLFFALCYDDDNVIRITETLYQKQYALAKTMGFTLYY